MKRNSSNWTLLQIRRGFSLVELLVVIAIIGLLAGLSVPTYNQLSKASNLTTSVQKVSDELNLARQTAITKNRSVEVRFYKLPEDGSTSTVPENFRAIQSFLMEEDAFVALGKTVYLPFPIIFSPESSQYSTLLDPGKERSPLDTQLLAGYGINYKYIAFRFRPSGETDLSQSKSCLTLLAGTDLSKANSKGKPLPADFFTIQIEPITGRIKIFRP